MKINWKWAFRGMMAFMVACFGVYWGSMTWLKVNEHEVVLPRLPEGLDGLRILHITDLHSDDPEKMHFDIWKTIDKLSFDMAVITGDMIMGGRRSALSELDPHLEALEALAARVPTFFVAGNHDYMVLPEMMALLESIGITTLQDEACVLVHNGTELTVAGTLDAYHYGKKENYHTMHEMMAQAGDGFRIVLTHQPQMFDALQAYAPDFVVAGHTHGGQLRLPFFPTLYAPGQGFFPKYGDGFYTDADTGAVMYVSRGIGATQFRVRFFNRPELAVFTLRVQKR